MYCSSIILDLADSGLFHGLLLTVWGPKAISMVVEPQDVLTCWSSRLTVWADSGPFLYYYSLLWGPGVISMINEPRGAFTCRSSTLIVLADSGPFRGLLLTVLGSRSNFHDL